MSAPVATDDLVQGAVKWLLGFADVTAVLGTYPATTTPYLFQHQLWAELEGSGSTAAVIGHGGGWGSPNDYNTMRFPRLSLELLADPGRDSGKNGIEPGEVYRRINAAYEVLDAHLHRPAPATVWWGTVRTIACTRLAEPIIYTVPDGDGLLRLQTFYAVVQA